MIYRASQTPGPGQYDPVEKKNATGKFSTSKPKSDVEWKIYNASKIPGPGQYDLPDMLAKSGGKIPSRCCACVGRCVLCVMRPQQAEERRGVDDLPRGEAAGPRPVSSFPLLCAAARRHATPDCAAGTTSIRTGARAAAASSPPRILRATWSGACTTPPACPAPPTTPATYSPSPVAPAARRVPRATRRRRRRLRAGSQRGRTRRLEGCQRRALRWRRLP
jgi:hypothetical protein